MNIEEIRYYCLSLPYTTECMPFDDTTLVFKVGKEETSKIFGLVSLQQKHYMMLKCDPDKAIELRETDPNIEPAYHMNKKHWNGIIDYETMNDQKLVELINHSYDLVVKSLPKYLQQELKEKNI